MCLQALAEQQKAQQLAQQQQAGAPQTQAAPGQAQAPAAGQAQAQVPQTAAVAGAAAVPNAAVLVRIKTSSTNMLPHIVRFKRSYFTQLRLLNLHLMFFRLEP